MGVLGPAAPRVQVSSAFAARSSRQVVQPHQPLTTGITAAYSGTMGRRLGAKQGFQWKISHLSSQVQLALQEPRGHVMCAM
jgi:hypothetical protein